MKLKHFLKISDFTKTQLLQVLDMSNSLKTSHREKKLKQSLSGKSLVMIFDKPSTRTRLSFEIGMQELGGIAVVLQSRDTQLGRGEPIEDAAKVISRMCDIIMIRTFDQKSVESFSNHSCVPVINGLTNEHHPCQILADVFTFMEYRGTIENRKVTWIGDLNNMCFSWVEASSILDFKLNISCPPALKKNFVSSILPTARNCTFFDDPFEACENSDLVTTDVWTSMGYEDEEDKRKKLFGKWSVTKDKIENAARDCLFMHCLPAHRGEEVSAEVIDGPRSVVWDEAENRLHVQKALIEFLLLGRYN
ncbi:MAG: ornithine carbamoyltransferase [Betaproteobacteria bacterium TMED82]|nr:MAG: ornithine carbamoyltransferase [Betaproteobacteria bacterium TMED82]|tara:strand:- start:50614 stop:51531 length:918 start_codon:yes stop_codon:yes gene_type:complete